MAATKLMPFHFIIHPHVWFFKSNKGAFGFSNVTQVCLVFLMLNLCFSIPTFLVICLGAWSDVMFFSLLKPVDLVVLKLASPEIVVIEENVSCSNKVNWHKI